MAVYEDDFGFSMVDPVNIEKLKKENIAVSEVTAFYKQQMLDMRNLILPLLKNLAKDPDKDIHWPNRDVKLQEFTDKLDAIVNKKAPTYT